MAEATTPKGEWKYSLLGAFLALLAVLTTSTLSYWSGVEDGKKKGKEEGLTEYHSMCYNVREGFVLIDNKAVFCGRIS